MRTADRAVLWPVRQERQRQHRPRTAHGEGRPQGPPAPPRLGAPEAHRPVIGAHGQEAPVLGERNRVEPLTLSDENPRLALALRDLPNLCRAVVGASYYQRAIWREGDAPDP